MSFGQNLQFLRKMRDKMSQEELAEKLGVSRQTVSKWELDAAYPEIDKIVELCRLFSCTMDELVCEDMGISDEAYSDIRVERMPEFRYVKYAVVSAEPEEDAIAHVERWARSMGMESLEIIGWDAPIVSQEQSNVLNMHGYEAALILKDGEMTDIEGSKVLTNAPQKYMAITIRMDPERSPFQLIPNAYKVLMMHMKVNGIKQLWDKDVISCFEKEYVSEGVKYMDVYIAAQ